jgi:hypothetical protein
VRVLNCLLAGEECGAPQSPVVKEFSTASSDVLRAFFDMRDDVAGLKTAGTTRTTTPVGASCFGDTAPTHVPLKRFPKRAGSQIHGRYSIRQVAHHDRLQFADNGYGARLLKLYAASGVPMLLHQGTFWTCVDCRRLFLVKFFTVCRRASLLKAPVRVGRTQSR